MLIKRLNIISEFLLYVLIYGITFSNAAVESATGFILFLFIIKRIIAKDIKPPKTELNTVLYLLFLVIFVSCVRSGYFKDSIKGLARAFKYTMLYFALIDLFSGDARRLRRFFWAVIFISCLTFINGIFQSISGFDFLRHRGLEESDRLARIKASFVHPNDFGTYIISVLPFSLAFFSRGLSARKRIFLAVVCFLGFYCLLRTSSRGAWLGFLIAASVYFFYYKKKAALFIPLIIFVCIAVFPNSPARITSMFKQDGNTVWERTQLWKGTWNMIKEHPVMGFGINTFSDYFPKYKPPGYPDLRYAHNSYLQMWSETGVIGLGVFLALVFVILRGSWRNLRKKIKDAGSDGFILLGAITGYIAFLTHASVDTGLYSLVLVTQFWVMTAYIISLNKILEGKIDA